MGAAVRRWVAEACGGPGAARGNWRELQVLRGWSGAKQKLLPLLRKENGIFGWTAGIAVAQVVLWLSPASHTFFGIVGG